MGESEITPPATKTLSVEFADASHLPVLYVNSVTISGDLDGFFFTLGVSLPPEEENIDHLTAKPVVRFFVPPTTMKQLIDTASPLYREQVALLKRISTNSQENQSDG